MRLMGMELYKIMHKKMTLFTGAALILILFTSFLMNVSSEESVVNGVRYLGFAAVAKNREITAPYIGKLTDQAVENMIDSYGFPHDVEYDYGYWSDQNFLNGFVTDYLSDGYMNGWEEGEYQVPEHVVPIDRSEIGKYAKAAGKEIQFGYYKGYSYLLDYWQMGMILAQIWILLALAPLFAEEFGIRTNPIIFTTQHGRKKDVLAKISAGLLVTLLAFFWVALSGLMLCGIVMGFDGANVFCNVVIGEVNANMAVSSNMTILSFTKLVLGIQFLGMILMGAISIWMSSLVKTSFHAVIYTGLIYLMPFLFHIVANSSMSYFIFLIMPIGRMMYRGVLETWHYAGRIQILLSVVLIFGCLESCWTRYRKADAF